MIFFKDIYSKLSSSSSFLYNYKRIFILTLLIISQISCFHLKTYADVIKVENTYNLALAQKVVAVADFTNDTGDQSMDYLKKGLANSLVTSLGVSKSNSFSIVERGQFESLIKEMGLAHTGVVDVSTATKIGNALGATEVIVGGIIKLGTTLRLNVRVIDVKTSKLQFAFTEYTNSEGDVLKLLDKIAEQIVSTLNPSEPSITLEKQPKLIEKELVKTTPNIVNIPTETIKIDTSIKKEEEGIPLWVWIGGGSVALLLVIIVANTGGSPRPVSAYPLPPTSTLPSTTPGSTVDFNKNNLKFEFKF